MKLRMRISDLDLIFLPGLGNSGPDHWQSRWQARLSTARRLDLPEWDAPECAAWASRITQSVAAAQRPIVFIAHDLGCNALVAAAADFAPDKVKGAFLVAPATPRRVAGSAGVDPAFARAPAAPLPFAAFCAASANDPFNDLTASSDWAAAVGAQFTSAGDAGHIDAASGHGPWPEGLLSLAGFLRKL